MEVFIVDDKVLEVDQSFTVIVTAAGDDVTPLASGDTLTVTIQADCELTLMCIIII